MPGCCVFFHISLCDFVEMIIDQSIVRQSSHHFFNRIYLKIHMESQNDAELLRVFERCPNHTWAYLDKALESRAKGMVVFRQFGQIFGVVVTLLLGHLLLQLSLHSRLLLRFFIPLLQHGSVLLPLVGVAIKVSEPCGTTIHRPRSDGSQIFCDAEIQL